jgi:hypothetical protein
MYLLLTSPNFPRPSSCTDVGSYTKDEILNYVPIPHLINTCIINMYTFLERDRINKGNTIIGNSVSKVTD